jgi:hypothetical protein
MYGLAKDTFAICEMQVVLETTAVVLLLQLLDEALRLKWQVCHGCCFSLVNSRHCAAS